MSFVNFKPSFQICKHTVNVSNGGVCYLCAREKSKSSTHNTFKPSVCQHGVTLGSGECWGCSYDKDFKQCIHHRVENKCNICKWKQPSVNKPIKQNLCPHWIPIHETCYVCERDSERKKYFHNGNVKIRENGNFFGNRIINPKDYVNPDDVNKNYPSTSNIDSQSLTSEAKTELSGREHNNRTKDSKSGNINSFMRRSLDTVGFIERNNKSNIWSNSIANSSFPTAHIADNEIENTYLGISTRGNRKLDNTDFNNDLHLRRSMLQPDFRQGNRFYEDKPANTRRESFRRLGNENVRKFQNQTESMYREMNYTKAYDQAAGINRG
jgi:hypothetical protein